MAAAGRLPFPAREAVLPRRVRAGLVRLLRCTRLVLACLRILGRAIIERRRPTNGAALRDFERGRGPAAMTAVRDEISHAEGESRRLSRDG
jgi:hypothetical protein